MLKVSVIMSTYNRAHMLPRAIASIRKQNYSNIQLVIANNGSTDNTYSVLDSKEIAEQCGSLHSVYIMHNSFNDSNVGNQLWELCTGDLICQLHDDDELTVNSISDRVALFESDPTLQVVYGGVIEQDLAGYPLRNLPGQPPDPLRIKIDEYINFTTMMWRRNLPFRFDTDLHYYTDWFFKIRCLNECNVAYTPSPVMRYTIHPGQESVRLRGTGDGEDKIMREKIKMLGYGN